MVEVYGDSIQTNYQNIYTNYSPTTPITKTNFYDNYYSGNFAYSYSLRAQLEKLGYNTTISPRPRQSIDYWNAKVLLDNNVYTLERETNSKWILISFMATASNGVSISNFQLKFKDGSNLTVEQAVNQKYIEPLVLVSSFSPNDNTWGNFYNIIYGEQTSTHNGPMGQIFIKLTGRSSLIGYSLTSSVKWNDPYDGIKVEEFSDNVKISTQPLR